MTEPLLIAKSGNTEPATLPGMATRPGLITGATGMGNTIMLQSLAEQFSRAGVHDG